MAEEKILQVIEELDNFLRMIDKRKYVEGKTIEMVDMVRNELRLILDLMADEKLEKEGRSTLRYWTADVVEMAHDAHLLIHKQSQSDYIWVSSHFSPILRALSETRKRILQLRDEGLNKSPTTSSSPPDEDVVGFEQDMESVLRKLIRGDARLSVTSIVGMTGIGKTTLARKVYHHARVVDRYEPRVWVCVSGEPSNKEMLMKLIRQVADNYEDQSHALLEDMDNQSLQRMLYHHLYGKQFLIVFDNIGEIPYFISILRALPELKKCRSRLLLTSQFRSINRRMEIYGEVYIMKPLDDDRSWQLFLKLLLFENQEFPKHLERKGKLMLRSCEGLPFSIKEVATKFVTKRQGGGEWEKLLDQSIDLSATLALLKSIYQRWPPRLKSCFLCLSFFKKSIPIKREKLVQIWSAGQVIPQEEEKYQDFKKVDFNLDFLEGYKTTLIKLVDEFIFEVDIRKDNSVKCIRVNASFHTLSMVKAEEEMVFETLKHGVGNLTTSSSEAHHRAIYCSRDEFSHFRVHDECLVSLFFRGGGYFEDGESYWKRFGQLRTLDFESFGLKMLPETIGSLSELRYLGLRDNYIQELPRSLGNLKNLEVLDIALNFTVVVPNILWKISSLRHLYMSDIICREPLKIDSLENLETLTYISIDNWTFKVSSLKMMTSLRKLGIEDMDKYSSLDKLIASLAYLVNLECLMLRGFRFGSLPWLDGLGFLLHLTELKLDGLIAELPSADAFPPKITHLSLINSCLDEDPMPELGKLENLSYLKLKNAYTGKQMEIVGMRLSKLKVLCLEELWHLRDIKLRSHQRCNLMKLEIKSCPFLEIIPPGIFSFHGKELKMLTTRRLAAKIRKSPYRISGIQQVDIQP